MQQHNIKQFQYDPATKSLSLNSLPPESWTAVFGDGAVGKDLSTRVPWVFLCSQLIAASVMTLPAYFIKENGDEWRLNGMEDPPMGYEWFDNWDELSYKVAFAAMNYGEAYILNRPAAGEFRWLSPKSITAKHDQSGRLSGFRRATGKERSITLDVEEVFHFWYPFSDMLNEGNAPPKVYPATIAMKSADSLRAWHDLIEAYFASGTIGNTFLKMPMPPNPTQQQEIKSWWSRVASGVKNAFAQNILGEGTEFVKMGDKLSEFYDEAVIEQTRREVEAAYGIASPHIVNSPPNLATKLADQVDFVEKTISPLAYAIATRLNQQVLAGTGWRLQYRPNELQVMQRDENEVADSLMKYKAAGFPVIVAAEVLGVELTDEQKQLIANNPDKQFNVEQTALGNLSRRENDETARERLERMREEERKTLARWIDNRKTRGKAIDWLDFSPAYLDPVEVKAIVEQETATAEDNPFPATATKSYTTHSLNQRNKIERSLVDAVAPVLAGMPKRIFKGGTDGWEQRLRDERDKLKAALVPHLKDALTLGLSDGREFVEVEVLGIRGKSLDINWSLVNDDAIAWLVGGGNIGTGYTDNLINELFNTTAESIRADLVVWLQSGESVGQLVDTLVNKYTFDRARAWAIAETEVTRAYAYGNRAAWRGSGLVDGMQWVTANDERVCPICAPLGGLKFGDDGAQSASVAEQEKRGVKVGIDDEFTHPGGKGAAGKFEGQSFELPPAHPRCRCSVRPLVTL